MAFLLKSIETSVVHFPLVNVIAHEELLTEISRVMDRLLCSRGSAAQKEQGVANKKDDLITIGFLGQTEGKGNHL
jgi:hypothetical protein